MTTVTEELVSKARRLHDDLENLRLELEHGPYSPGVKSAMSRDITESQERINAILRVCSPVVYVLVSGEILPAV